MNCPVCHVELRIADRQGIEIDYCPQCRGVWLDRGELDKIIERQPMAAPSRAEWAGGRGGYERDDDDDDYEHRRYPFGRNRRREGWLGELFDFG